MLRICETFCFIPDSIELFFAVITDFHHAWRIINTFAVFKHRNKQLTKCIGICTYFCLFPGFLRVENDHIFTLVKRFVGKTDQIGTDLSGRFAVNTVDRFVSRIRDLLNVFRKLDLRNIVTIRILNSSQLVYTAESRAILGSNHVGTHTPGINAASLRFQTGDQVFIQVTGG